MVDEMQEKEVRTAIVRKGASINDSNANDFYLVDLADINHASLMLTNFSIVIRNRDAKKRRVGSELVELKHGEAQTNHHCGRHSVNDNNINRQGCWSLEDSFLPNYWKGSSEMLC